MVSALRQRLKKEVPVTHPLVASQVSRPSQKCPLSHASLIGMWVTWSPSSSQASAVQGTPSSQSLAVLQQPVIGVLNPRRQEGGAHTQYVCVPAGQVAPVPAGTDLVAAATVPMNALTAMLSLELTGLKAGELLLVTGGAGMLGGSVLQLAKQAGIRAATNASEADAELVRSLGAETVLPRSEGLSEAFKAAYGQEADGLIDGALIGDHVSHLVKPGGVAVALRKSNPVTDSRLKCTYVSVLDAMARPEMVAAVGEHIAKGSLAGRVALDGVVPFSEAQAAFTMAEKNTARGRVVLRFAD